MSSKRIKKLPKKTSELGSETIKKLLPLVKKNCTTKFDESVDLSFQINNKQKKGEINIRNVINLPGGRGKKVKIAVVCEDAKSKECQIIGITTGGALSKRISDNSPDCIFMPSGLQPRAALAYSFVPMLYLLLKLELIEIDLQNSLVNSISLLKSVRDNYKLHNENNKSWFLSNEIKMVKSVVRK